jgi:peptidoglycan/LPS O-acetylase OafA/YrhL
MAVKPVHLDRPKTPARHFYHIDIIRFLSALAVVIFHFGYINEHVDYGLIWPITWFGWLGVEPFFHFRLRDYQLSLSHS